MSWTKGFYSHKKSGHSLETRTETLQMGTTSCRVTKKDNGWMRTHNSKGKSRKKNQAKSLKMNKTRKIATVIFERQINVMIYMIIE